MTDFSAPTGAVLSPCERYRYVLWRSWDRDLPSLTWVMLNPSTADATKDDATIRICRGRAERTGYGTIYVVNLFAWRATYPGELYAVDNPISGPEQPEWNDDYIEAYTKRADLVICAWGAHGAHRGRGNEVLARLRMQGRRPHALRLTKDGHPCHPLRIPYSEQPFPI